MHYIRVQVVDVYCLIVFLDAAVLIPDAIALVFGPLPRRLVILQGRSGDAAAGLQQWTLVSAVRGSSDRGVYTVVHEKRGWTHWSAVFRTLLRRLGFSRRWRCSIAGATAATGLRLGGAGTGAIGKLLVLVDKINGASRAGCTECQTASRHVWRFKTAAKQIVYQLLV